MKHRHRRFMGILGAGALGALAWPVPAMAGSDGQRRPPFEITPFGGYRLGGSLDLNDPSYRTLEFGDGGVYGLALGVHVEPVEGVGEAAVEVMWTHQESTLKALPNPGVASLSMNMNVDQFHFNGYYGPPQKGYLRTYVIAGLGATRFSPTGNVGSLSLFSWALGLGAKVPFTPRLALRVEAKWDPALANASGGIFCNSSTGQCFVAASGSPINQFDFTAGLALRI